MEYSVFQEEGTAAARMKEQISMEVMANEKKK